MTDPSKRSENLQTALRKHQALRALNELLIHIPSISLIKTADQSDITRKADAQLTKCFRGDIAPTSILKGNSSEAEVAEYLRQKNPPLIDGLISNTGEILAKLGDTAEAGWLHLKTSGHDWLNNLWANLNQKELYLLTTDGSHLFAITEEEVGFFIYDTKLPP